MELERKQLPFVNAKATGDGDGSVEGYASVFGQVDAYGDTIIPGAYAGTIDAFKRDGFLAWSHDWANLVGTPSDVYEDEVGLYLKADFHTHERAQEARQITTERLSRGKSMGLSIGYQAVKWSYQEGEDGRTRRVLEEIKLYEVSLVAVPADTFARVSAAKGQVPYAERLRQFGSELDDLLAYTKARADMRAKQDRKLGDETVAALQSLTERLPRVCEELESLYAEPKAGAPEAALPSADQQPDLVLLRLQFEHIRAHALGALT